jgi:D-alanine-D-alanine ligase
MESILSNKKIGIITGSWSGERVEAIISGKNLLNTLAEQGIKSDLLIIPETWDILPMLVNANFDFIFLETTEEVPIQPFLNALGIPHTGSNFFINALSLNKNYVKTLLRNEGLNVPGGVVVRREDAIDTNSIKYPSIVKPVGSGSSCGVSLVKDYSRLQSSLNDAFLHDTEVLIEPYLDGQEITIPIIGDFLLPMVKINSPIGFWDEKRKSNLEVSFKAIPYSEIEMYKKMQNIVNKIRKLFKFENFWRIDTIFKDGEFSILEINSLPCMSGGITGLLPCAEKELGWTHFQFLTKVAEESMQRFNIESKHVLRKID